jgi:hypothetical protein
VPPRSPAGRTARRPRPRRGHLAAGRAHERAPCRSAAWRLPSRRADPHQAIVSDTEQGPPERFPMIHRQYQQRILRRWAISRWAILRSFSLIACGRIRPQYHDDSPEHNRQGAAEDSALRAAADSRCVTASDLGEAHTAAVMDANPLFIRPHDGVQNRCTARPRVCTRDLVGIHGSLSSSAAKNAAMSRATRCGLLGRREVPCPQHHGPAPYVVAHSSYSRGGSPAIRAGWDSRTGPARMCPRRSLVLRQPTCGSPGARTGGP